MRYEKANNAINLLLLSGRYAGRPFYFSLSNSSRKALVDSLGHDSEAIESEICRSVGHRLQSYGDPYEPLVKEGRRWWYLGHKQPPPFSAVLFALSHAAALMAADEEFGGGNFYDRLSEATGFEVGPLRNHGKSTEQLWKWFNAWLIENDYELGKPTAQTFNSNKYVNYPQSQAVIRGGDRHVFHHMFERFGLTGSEAMIVDDIQPYLEYWMHSSRPNARLKAAWRRPELRNRFCEVVLAELADWSAGTDEDGARVEPTLRMSLAASLVEAFPHPKLTLALGQPGEGPVKGEFIQTRFPTRPISLSNHVFGNFKTLRPDPLSFDPNALSWVFEASNATEKSRAYWSPRLIIPLARSESGPYWLETIRVKMAKEYLVLVRDTSQLVSELDAYLASTSSGEFKVASPSALIGVPKGWLAYIGVRILVSGAPASQNISPVVPMGEGGSELLFEGGLRLSNGIWHAQAPPDVHFLASAPPTLIKVSKIGDNDNAQLLKQESVTREASIKPDELKGLGEAELEIEATGSETEKKVQAILLRSALRPRPPSRQTEGELTYWCSATASRASHIPSRQLFPNLAGATNPPEVAPSVSSHVSNVTQGSKGVDTQAAICVLRGYHVWKGEYYPPGTKPPKQQPAKCNSCGEEILVGKNQSKREKVQPPPRWQPAEKAASNIDHDLILDALSFLGSGTYGQLETLLSQYVEESWQAGAFASEYSALGFLDLEIEPGSGRVRYWSVPQQTAWVCANGTIAITGFRSRSTCRSLREAVNAAGGVTSFDSRGNRPAKLTVTGLSPEAFSDLASKLLDPLDRPFSVLRDAPTNLLDECENLEPLTGILRPISLAVSDIREKFDCTAGKWSKLEKLSANSGAFRSDWAGTTYVWKGTLGGMFSGPHQVVKLMAAREARIRLHTHDKAQENFVSKMGTEPIGLLARSLVSCSGELPRPCDAGLVYSQVPAPFAARLLKILYEEGSGQ